MVQPSGDARFLALRDKAYALLAERGAVDEGELLRHVYGGAAPDALRSQLSAPLLADPRFARDADGTWRVVAAPAAGFDAFTTLALATTGPSAARGRIVCVAALHVSDGAVQERFMATVHPGVRVPRYVADRLGLDPAVLDTLRPFTDIADDLERFLGDRPIVAQDAELAWSFLEAEARRAGRALRELPLVDVNDLATAKLQLEGKPTLARIAARLGVPTGKIEQPEEEARVLFRVALGLHERGNLAASAPQRGSRALQRPSTARDLPDVPGVYALRDADQNTLYVGKARRLRSRVTAYVQRPLGATRRLEGLVGSVQDVAPIECDTDLDALVLEDREIRRLEPRFNTVRQSRAPKLWIRLPPVPSKRGQAPRRLELSVTVTGEGDFVGPFRNQMAAEQARALARDVFELDVLRRSTDLFAYEARLGEAWQFLHGASSEAERLARERSVKLLRAVLAFDVASLLLPADPRSARYAVLRWSPSGDVLEGFVLDHGVCTAWRECADAVGSPEFVAALLADSAPRTTPDDVDVVLRWFGAQRPNARLICVPRDDPQAAADGVLDAALALWEARAADLEHARNALADAALGSAELA